jgi:hypothetical protein
MHILLRESMNNNTGWRGFFEVKMQMGTESIIQKAGRKAFIE